MRDIAERCGVTTATVSLALRKDPRLSSATIERVLAVAAEIGYDRAQNQAARRMVLRRYGRDVINRVIAIFLPRTFHKAAYFSNILEGVLDVLTDNDFTLLIGYTRQSQLDQPSPLLPLINSGDVDGVLIVDYRERTAERLRALPGFGQRPIISLIYSLTGCSVVRMDDEQGAFQAAMHLLEQGHRHFLHFYNPTRSPMEHRFHGLCRAIREYGLDPGQHARLAPWTLAVLTPPYHLELAAPGKNSVEAEFFRREQDAFLHFIHDHPEITAVLAANDPIARRVWYLLQHAGLRVPEDISIIGYDDTDPMSDDLEHRVLTSVHLPLIELGRAAARLVIRQVTTRATACEEIVLPTSLTVRTSTAPAAR